MLNVDIGKWCAGAVLAVFTAVSQAATVSLSPLSQNVALGNPVSLLLNMDFTGDPTLGGGVDIFYNSSLLSFVSFTFDSGLGDETSLRRLPDVLTNELNGLAFNSFTGLSGPSLVGTLTFNTIGAGTALFTMADNDFPAGGFYSAATFDPQAVTYQGVSVNVTAVPLPAAVWLMLSGMGLIGAMTQRKRG